LKTALCYWNF